MLLHYILITILQIDPSSAVETISKDNVFGALSIILIFFLAGALLYIRKNFQRQITDLKTDLTFSKTRQELVEGKNEECRKEFQNYLQNTVKENIEVIKRFTERMDDHQKTTGEMIRLLTSK